LIVEVLSALLIELRFLSMRLLEWFIPPLISQTVLRS